MNIEKRTSQTPTGSFDITRRDIPERLKIRDICLYRSNDLVEKTANTAVGDLERGILYFTIDEKPPRFLEKEDPWLVLTYQDVTGKKYTEKYHGWPQNSVMNASAPTNLPREIERWLKCTEAF